MIYNLFFKRRYENLIFENRSETDDLFWILNNAHLFGNTKQVDLNSIVKVSGFPKNAATGNHLEEMQKAGYYSYVMSNELNLALYKEHNPKMWFSGEIPIRVPMITDVNFEKIKEKVKQVTEKQARAKYLKNRQSFFRKILIILKWPYRIIVDNKIKVFLGIVTGIVTGLITR